MKVGVGVVFVRVHLVSGFASSVLFDKRGSAPEGVVT